MVNTLQVGVHNGWCYLEKPETFHLDVTVMNDKSKSLKPTASPSIRRSKKFLQTSQKAGEGYQFLTYHIHYWLILSFTREIYISSFSRQIFHITIK